MTEAKLSNCLLTALIILTTIMFIWTIGTISSANQLKLHTEISAFNA